jgi:outer membrane protein assembly factor BamB
MVNLHGIASVAGLAICVFSISPPSRADEWTQFRGPNGQGRCASADLPVSWSEQEGIVWKTPIPGRGWSSPVTLEGNIWLTTATQSGHSLRALCLVAKTGPGPLGR